MTNEAFADAIIAMQGTLYRVAYGLLPREADREDAVQETIRRAWHRRETLRDTRFLQTWVIRILIRECGHIAGKTRREIPTDCAPTRTGTPQDININLHDAFLALDARTRLPAILYYMEGYDTREIAAMLRLPVGTVKSRLHRARAALRGYLGEGYAHE